MTLAVPVVLFFGASGVEDKNRLCHLLSRLQLRGSYRGP